MDNITTVRLYTFKVGVELEAYSIETKTEQETVMLGNRLSQLLKPGNVITLEGDLGAGKTTFTKGIAQGLGITDVISSPTFTIIKEYQGVLPLYHMDAYRLEFSEEDLGFDEYFAGEGVSVVEWATFIEDFLPEERLDVKIKYQDESSRIIQFTPHGPYFKWVMVELSHTHF